MNKRGNILVENVVFIVLNMIFLIIMILFLFSRMGDTAILEEKYAKQIAMAIDSAKPGMDISINMKEAVDKAKEEHFSGKIVFIEDNIVSVKLRDKGVYSYSFFNNVDLSQNYFYPDQNEYNFKIERYK